MDESKDVDDLQPGISPLMFRTLVGRGHAEFSTKKQQDAMEFLEHVLKMTSCNSGGTTDPGNCFKFEVHHIFQFHGILYFFHCFIGLYLLLMYYTFYLPCLYFYQQLIFLSLTYPCHVTKDTFSTSMLSVSQSCSMMKSVNFR